MSSHIIALAGESDISFIDQSGNVFVGELKNVSRPWLADEAKATFTVTHWIQGGWYGKAWRHAEMTVSCPKDAVLSLKETYLVAVVPLEERAMALIEINPQDALIRRVEEKIHRQESKASEEGSVVDDIFSELVNRLPVKHRKIRLYSSTRVTTIEREATVFGLAKRTVTGIQGSSFGPKKTPYLSIDDREIHGDKAVYKGRVSDGPHFTAEAAKVENVFYLKSIKISDGRVFAIDD